jgi:hypothetical protein
MVPHGDMYASASPAHQMSAGLRSHAAQEYPFGELSSSPVKTFLRKPLQYQCTTAPSVGVVSLSADAS